MAIVPRSIGAALETDSVPMERKLAFTGLFYKEISPAGLIINYILP
ncbi:MAG: hypothetical protein R2830_20330 [Saprospiraceae bacterium]